MRQVLEGSHAVSEAVRLARVQVMSAYPITPQTHIVEALSEFCADETMDARFICVESEHSAMAAIIGASLTGKKVMTATSGPGFSLMQEALGYAVMAEIPCVIVNVQRGGPSTGTQGIDQPAH